MLHYKHRLTVQSVYELQCMCTSHKFWNESEPIEKAKFCVEKRGPAVHAIVTTPSIFLSCDSESSPCLLRRAYDAAYQAQPACQQKSRIRSSPLRSSALLSHWSLHHTAPH